MGQINEKITRITTLEENLEKKQKDFNELNSLIQDLNKEIEELPVLEKEYDDLKTLEKKLNILKIDIQVIVIATQHIENVSSEEIEQEIREKVINYVIPKELIDDKTKIHINRTGRLTFFLRQSLKRLWTYR